MNLNILKGFLIILVIIDHNDFSRSIFPGFLSGLSFHVLGFLTIPFLKAPEKLWTKTFVQSLFRLYYPYFMLTCVMAVLVSILASGANLGRLMALLLALYSGNADILKQVTHMSMLWFLPSFISILVIRGAIESVDQPVKVFALMVLVVMHLFIGKVASDIQHYLPLGLLPALYSVPLAYLAVLLHRIYFARRSPSVALLVGSTLFVAVKLLQMHMRLDNEIGFAAVADYRNPLELLVNDMEAVSGTLMLFQACRLNFGKFIEVCGKFSMQIYLFHAFISLLISKALLWMTPSAAPLLLFVLSMAVTTVLSVVLSYFLLKQRQLKRLIFPHDVFEILGTGSKPTDMPQTGPNRRAP